MARILKCSLWVPLMRLHHIHPGFLIWPTFQGHRVQILCTLLSVNMVARLLTVAARNFKLRLRMYYDNMTSHTKHHRDLTYFLVYRWPSMKTVSICFLYLMNDDSYNYLLCTSHETTSQKSSALNCLFIYQVSTMSTGHFIMFHHSFYR
jgi:hypothetical protein